MEQEIKSIYFIIAALYEEAKIEQTGDSLMFFAPYYMNKYFRTIDYFKFYEYNDDLNALTQNTEELEKIAQELVRKYCMSGRYSSKEDSDEVFLQFLNEEYDKMKVVANALGENKPKARH